MKLFSLGLSWKSIKTEKKLKRFFFCQLECVLKSYILIFNCQVLSSICYYTNPFLKYPGQKIVHNDIKLKSYFRFRKENELYLSERKGISKNKT